jgi:hypothetical protein
MAVRSVNWDLAIMQCIHGLVVSATNLEDSARFDADVYNNWVLREVI